MHRRLTITIDDDVYRGLHNKAGRGQISQFIEDLVRPHVVEGDRIEALYREAAKDAALEAEALAWIEAVPDEALE